MIQLVSRFSVYVCFCWAFVSCGVVFSQIPNRCDTCLPSPASPSQPTPANRSSPNWNPQSAGVYSASPQLFTAPSPSGEVAGARSGFALPSMTFSLPRITLETPEFRINGITRYRREAHMQLDTATAPLTYNRPAVYGHLTGASLQNGYRQQSPQSASPAPRQQPVPASPPVEPNDNCVRATTREDVRELTEQVRQLQALVGKLAEAQHKNLASTQQGVSGQVELSTPQPFPLSHVQNLQASPAMLEAYPTHDEFIKVYDTEEGVIELKREINQLHNEVTSHKNEIVPSNSLIKQAEFEQPPQILRGSEAIGNVELKSDESAKQKKKWRFLPELF